MRDVLEVQVGFGYHRDDVTPPWIIILHALHTRVWTISTKLRPLRDSFCINENSMTHLDACCFHFTMMPLNRLLHEKLIDSLSFS